MQDRVVLECEGIHHWFGPKKVLYDINLKILRGEIVALVGPSGCGKSTLLRAIVGTHPPRRGRVIVREKEADAYTAREVTQPGRDRGIVYQGYSLFPNLTAVQNVAFGLMVDQTSIPSRLLRYGRWRRLRRAHLSQATELLEKLGLGHATHNYPHELSGGMQQRVAIAQALVMKPAILLLDEPFGALDEATREELQRMLLSLYAENIQSVAEGGEPPYTILMVTHELNEAIYVSDRVIGLSQYWSWEKDGHPELPGATIVYDKVAPVFRPDDVRSYIEFRTQKEEVLRTTFDPEVRQKRDEWLQFWNQVQNGEAQGVTRT